MGPLRRVGWFLLGGVAATLLGAASWTTQQVAGACVECGSGVTRTSRGFAVPFFPSTYRASSSEEETHPSEVMRRWFGPGHAHRLTGPRLERLTDGLGIGLTAARHCGGRRVNPFVAAALDDSAFADFVDAEISARHLDRSTVRDLCALPAVRELADESWWTSPTRVALLRRGDALWASYCGVDPSSSGLWGDLREPDDVAPDVSRRRR